MKYCIFFLCSCLMADPVDHGWAEGKNTGSAAGHYFKSDPDHTISHPMTTHQLLSTLDGRQSAEAKLICAQGHTKEYLTISYRGGDNISIQVLLDKNLDGSKDTAYTFNGISGICADGIIRCPPHTWGKSCQYYQWHFSSHLLSLNPALYSDLNNCYCINGSCGHLATTAKVKILDDLGGSLSSLISSSSSNFIITKGSNNGTTISYWGQDYSNCSNHQGSTHINPLEIDHTEAEIKNQLNNKNSAYYVLNESTDNAIELESDFENNLTTKTTNILNSTHQQGASSYSYQEGSMHVKGSVFYKNMPQAKYCEVAREENNTAAFSDNTNRKTSTSSATMTTTEIRQCTSQYSLCPVHEGEIIKHHCGAIDDFAQVGAWLESVDEATRDRVCSSH